MLRSSQRRVSWTFWSEWGAVRDGLFSVDPVARLRAVKRVPAAPTAACFVVSVITHFFSQGVGVGKPHQGSRYRGGYCSVSGRGPSSDVSSVNIVSTERLSPKPWRRRCQGARMSEQTEQLCRALAIIRLVNGLIEPLQKAHREPVHHLAARIGLPPMLVELRHMVSSRAQWRRLLLTFDFYSRRISSFLHSRFSLLPAKR